jgi:hypothetical protein
MPCAWQKSNDFDHCHYRTFSVARSWNPGLVVNAIVLWNTLYMEATLNQLRAEGMEVNPEDVARLSPLIHKHMNFQGRYSFALSESVARGGLRPLRDPSEQDE